MTGSKKEEAAPRLISADEIKQHNGRNGESFWAVVDGFVVDATEFVADGGHPGGLKKLLSTDAAGTGATGKPFGFSFSRGRNAHFPQTGQRFQEGAKRFLSGVSESEANAAAARRGGVSTVWLNCDSRSARSVRDL